jgi:hypothetical protein
MAFSTGVAESRARESDFRATAGTFSPALSIDPATSVGNTLKEYYDAMSAHLGPMKWWQAKNAFEAMAGAILTQNTAWKNVKPAQDWCRKREALCSQCPLGALLSATEIVLSDSEIAR